MDKKLFEDDLKKSFLNESVENNDEDCGQYEIVKEGEFNGKKFMIVHDGVNDYFKFAIEGDGNFEDKNYPNFDGYFDTEEDAFEEMKKTIGVFENAETEDGQSKDEIIDFLASKLGSDFKFEKEEEGDCKKIRILGKTARIDADFLAKKLEEKFNGVFFGVHRVKYFAITNAKDGERELFYVTACPKDDGKNLEENASPEDKEAAQVLNGIADAKEQAGEKDKAEALRAAAKTMEEAVNISELDKVLGFISDKIGVELTKDDVEVDGTGVSISIDGKCEGFDLAITKDIAEFVKNETNTDKLPDVYVDDTKCPKAIYIDGFSIEKPVEESVQENGLIEVPRIFYGFVIPKYVVELFGEDAFINEKFSKTKDGRIALMHELATDEDMSAFFGVANEAIVSDYMSTIENLIAKLNDDSEDKLDVEMETVMEDIETGYFIV